MSIVIYQRSHTGEIYVAVMSRNWSFFFLFKMNSYLVAVCIYYFLLEGWEGVMVTLAVNKHHKMHMATPPSDRSREQAKERRVRAEQSQSPILQLPAHCEQKFQECWFLESSPKLGWALQGYSWLSHACFVRNPSPRHVWATPINSSVS